MTPIVEKKLAFLEGNVFCFFLCTFKQSVIHCETSAVGLEQTLWLFILR